MKNLNKEIDEMTEQKEWKIPPNVMDKIREFRRDKNKISEEIDDLETEMNYKKASKKMAHMKLWRELHSSMPDLPNEQSLSLEIEEGVVRVSKDDGPGDFLKRLLSGRDL